MQLTRQEANRLFAIQPTIEQCNTAYLAFSQGRWADSAFVLAQARDDRIKEIGQQNYEARRRAAIAAVTELKTREESAVASALAEAVTKKADGGDENLNDALRLLGFASPEEIAALTTQFAARRKAGVPQKPTNDQDLTITTIVVENDSLIIDGMRYFPIEDEQPWRMPVADEPVVDELPPIVPVPVPVPVETERPKKSPAASEVSAPPDLPHISDGVSLTKDHELRPVVEDEVYFAPARLRGAKFTIESWQFFNASEKAQNAVEFLNDIGGESALAQAVQDHRISAAHAAEAIIWVQRRRSARGRKAAATRKLNENAKG